ncbi:MAG TPA: arsenite methyltransferase [Candidatus Kryptonia bacterium]
MKSDSQIKEEVREKYAEIARGDMKSIKNTSKSCSCGSKEVVDLSLHYKDSDTASIPDGADLGLGCGTPTAFADILEGMTVLDLGSGAGVDCFIAAKEVGPRGKVIGVDMTKEMIDKANQNKAKINAGNVEFRLGEIESLPVEENTVDRVISNCVINLVPNKEKAFGEICRVLKKGGKLTVSDIVTDGQITEAERLDASLWAGCVSGALDKKEYLNIITNAGFEDVRVTAESKTDYQLSSGASVYSITVTATK